MKYNIKLIERHGCAADKEWLWNLYEQLLKDPIEAQWGWDKSYQLENFKTEFLLENFVIVSDGEVDIGTYYTNEHCDYYYVKLILISEPFQKMGIGKHIVTKLQCKAKKSQKNIKLSVIQKNPVAGFYEKLGFKRLYESDGSIQMKWEY